jgi:hypothetical protein
MKENIILGNGEIHRKESLIVYSMYVSSACMCMHIHTYPSTHTHTHTHIYVWENIQHINLCVL